jgi:cysteine desulfurase family protein
MHYFDNAATSWPKPGAVYEAVEHWMRHNGANPGRSGHCLAKAADDMVHETRELLARFFNAPDPDCVAFTFNGTDGLNMVIKGLLSPGQHVVTSTIEHNSVSRPLRALESKGVEVTYLQADEEGFLHADELEKAMRDDTRLVLLCHASNVLGAVQDVSSLSRTAHRHQALFALDAAQTAGVYPIDMQSMGIDILVVPGHKSLLGPFGTGAVVTVRDVGLCPWREGGTGTRSDARIHPEQLPYRLEGGTLNATGVAGLGAALKFISAIGLDEIRRLEQGHISRIMEVLLRYEHVSIYGPLNAEQRAGLVSFNVKGLGSEELGAVMNDRHKIAGRPGLHCAPMAHRTVRTFPGGSYRLSPGYFTTDEDIQVLEKALQDICSHK